MDLQCRCFDDRTGKLANGRTGLTRSSAGLTVDVDFLDGEPGPAARGGGDGPNTPGVQVQAGGLQR